MRLLILAGSLALGWFIGSRKAFGVRARRFAHPIMLVALGLLLFGMGVSLGSRPEIVANLHTIGVQAVSISLAGAVGAVGAVAILRRIWRVRNGGKRAR
jgi:uncharacterized membrane protein YbjE (DUF340 family)